MKDDHTFFSLEVTLLILYRVLLEAVGKFIILGTGVWRELSC